MAAACASLMSVTMTCAPERANRSAMAAPMPDPAPVTSAVLPASVPMIPAYVTAKAYVARPEIMPGRFGYAGRVRVETLFLDAGGVLVFPNWSRVSDVLSQHGVRVDAATLGSAEPHAKQQIDVGATVSGTNDRERGWLYFNLVLTQAGVPLGEQTDAALAELHTYHSTMNLWETVPADVVPALDRLRGLGLKLAVISNANGTLHAVFE